MEVTLQNIEYSAADCERVRLIEEPCIVFQPAL